MSKRSHQVKWARFREERYYEYQRIAIDLFHRNGYENVTVSDIAQAAGVTTRTLYRYFPTKEDFVISFGRATLDRLLDATAELEPNDDPMGTVWSMFEQLASTYGADLAAGDKWRRVAEDVPGIRHRVRGERVSMLMEALTDYCERSLGVAPGADVRPRVMAGLLCGAELAVMTFWEGPRTDLEAYFRESRALIDALDGPAGAAAPAAPPRLVAAAETSREQAG